MYLRISSAFSVCAVLAACDANTSPEPEGPQVECAIGAGADFTPSCTLELVDDDEFVIHHHDGSFRRFVFTDTGLLSVSDGAENVVEERISVADGLWEFRLEVDRYRMDGGLVPRIAGE